METNDDRAGSAAPADADAGAAAAAFLRAQERLLERYRLDARRHEVEVPLSGRSAQVLVAGEGEPLVMVMGGAVPAAFWIPLMAKLTDRRLYAIELPGFGLTDPVPYRHETLRRTAVGHLTGVLDALDLGASDFVTQSMGSQWTVWLAKDQPGRVRSQVMIGCPAFFLDTSAVLPFRLVSVPVLGSILMSLQQPSAKNAERVMRTVGEDPAGLDEIRDVLVAAQRLPAYNPTMIALMRAVMRWTVPRPTIVSGPDDLREIHHPVRLVWGERDGFGPPEAGRRMAALIPGADLHVVAGGHAPWFHHADLVAHLVREHLDRSR